MNKHFFLLIIGLFNFQVVSAQKTSDTTWLNKPHFKIQTATTIYLYDKAGGGMSSIIDNDGNDWVSFNETGDDEYPASAAGRFRGLPNFVFGSEDSGAGHPGFDQCISTKISDKEILTKTKSGLWQWSWQFFDEYAQVTMEKVNPNHAYWFLYEGTPGGSYQPKQSYWGTNTRPTTTTTPDYINNGKIFEDWAWVFFGRNDVKRTFFIAMESPDEEQDTFSYLGNTKEGVNSPNGMTVFGFGREDGAKPQMTKTANRFIIGFYANNTNSKKQYKKLGKYIDKLKKGL